MSDFDPDADLETQEQADAYVSWAADQFMRLSQGPHRTYRTALRCAHWLFLVASAQLHLDESVERDHDALLEQLARYQQVGRALERQREEIPVEQVIVLRSSLDCWESVGGWAESLLIAAKCAVAALLLIEIHPLIDRWDVECPDVWALLDEGHAALASIEVDEALDLPDFAVRPDERVIALFTWQRAMNIHHKTGSPPPSPN